MARPEGRAVRRTRVALLARAGVDVAALADPGRQLHRCARPRSSSSSRARPTSPSTSRTAASTSAIAGADVLVEAGLDVVELLDLRFGGCRFVVAEPEDAARRGRASGYRHLGVHPRRRRSTRASPRRTSRAKGMQVEIVKLHGNIELAPLHRPGRPYRGHHRDGDDAAREPPADRRRGAGVDRAVRREPGVAPRTDAERVMRRSPSALAAARPPDREGGESHA